MLSRYVIMQPLLVVQTHREDPLMCRADESGDRPGSQVIGDQ